MATVADKAAEALDRAAAAASVAERLAALPVLFRAMLEREWAERRFFLWLPVCAGAGVALYFAADQEPSLVYAAGITAVLSILACLLRSSRKACVTLMAAAGLASGFTAATLRTATLTHPVLDRMRIVKLSGFVEEVDHRRTGARFVLRIAAMADASLAGRLTRVRLTTRRQDQIEAGDAVALTVRLVPPARAALPGGFDFSRDAYFAGFDAVGSVLGRIRADTQPRPASLVLRFHAAVDRVRNALATRVSQILEGDVGAIGAAMVTGKRDLLSDDGRELIREAGIFHIITIAGVQMTLVAGLLFGGLRAAFAAVPALALRYPVKAWAAAGAIVGAVAYDILTGSRIGTQRALLMTTVMLGAVLCGRRAFTMRNLALAALAVIALEPETVLGASFQLSFSAVAALVAVQEARLLHPDGVEPDVRRGPARTDALVFTLACAAAFGRWIARLFVATLAATSATAPVMASDFHEISPYVTVGNPLTLSIIEFFAVPGALVGSVLYPLGLDRPVWHWVGWGIELVLWAARLIASTPGATLAVPAFAPWALPCFALATCSAVIWRSVPLRLTALPLFAAGLIGTVCGPHYDLIVAPGGDAAAFRSEGGTLAFSGRLDPFVATQWLRADGDARQPDRSTADSLGALRCDALACVGRMNGGDTLSLVTKAEAFEEDCRRADVIVTPLFAPASCAAEVIVDRGTLAETGAVAFTRRNGALIAASSRATGEDRPWSPAPSTRPPPPEKPVEPSDAAETAPLPSPRDEPEP